VTNAWKFEFPNIFLLAPTEVTVETNGQKQEDQITDESGHIVDFNLIPIAWLNICKASNQNKWHVLILLSCKIQVIIVEKNQFYPY